MRGDKDEENKETCGCLVHRLVRLLVTYALLVLQQAGRSFIFAGLILSLPRPDPCGSECQDRLRPSTAYGSVDDLVVSHACVL